MFRGCRPEDMPPHIYAVAQTAYRNLLSSRHDQSIVLLGRSGSGKTTNARHLMQYYLVSAGCISVALTGEIGIQPLANYLRQGGNVFAGFCL